MAAEDSDGMAVEDVHPEKIAVDDEADPAPADASPPEDEDLHAGHEVHEIEQAQPENGHASTDYEEAEMESPKPKGNKHGTPSKGATTPRTGEKSGRPGSARAPAFSPIYLSSPRPASAVPHSVRESEIYIPHPKSPEEAAALAEAVARRAVIPASGKGGAPRPHPIMPMVPTEKPKPSPPKAPAHHIPPKPAPKPLTSGSAPDAAKPFAERAPQFANKQEKKERPSSAKAAPKSPGVKFAPEFRPKSAGLSSEHSTTARLLAVPLPNKAAQVTGRLYTVPNGTARQDLSNKPKPKPILAGAGSKAPPRPLPPVPRNARVSPPSNRRKILPDGRPSKATIAQEQQRIIDMEKEAAKVELDSKLEAARARSEGTGQSPTAEGENTVFAPSPEPGPPSPVEA